MFGDDLQIADAIKNFMLQNLTSEGAIKTAEYFDQLIAKLSFAHVGFSGFLGFLLTLILLLRNIEIVFNKIWEIEATRSMLSRLIFFWTILTLGFFLLSLVLGALTNLHLGESSVKNFIFGFFDGSYLSSQSTSLIIFSFLVILYRVVPNCFVSFRAVFIGAGISAIVFHYAKLFFAMYLKNMSNFENIYGALGALPATLIWLYICWLIVLCGGVITCRIDKGWTVDEYYKKKGALVKDRLNDMKTRTILPIVLLIHIYFKFLNKLGAENNGFDFCKKFKCPKFWICEALLHLVENKLICTSKNIVDEYDDDFLFQKFYPAMPAEAMTLEILNSKVYTSNRHVLNLWQDSFGEEYTNIIKTIITTPNKDVKDVNLKDLLIKK